MHTYVCIYVCMYVMYVFVFIYYYYLLFEGRGGSFFKKYLKAHKTRHLSLSLYPLVRIGCQQPPFILMLTCGSNMVTSYLVTNRLKQSMGLDHDDQVHAQAVQKSSILCAQRQQNCRLLDRKNQEKGGNGVRDDHAGGGRCRRRLLCQKEFLRPTIQCGWWRWWWHGRRRTVLGSLERWWRRFIKG